MIVSKERQTHTPQIKQSIVGMYSLSVFGLRVAEMSNIVLDFVQTPFIQVPHIQFEDY